MITFETANEMKKLGLTQKRHKSAKYYVTPDIIMDFEAIHDLKDAKAWFKKRFDEQVNWMEHFTYIPELIDLIGIESYNLTLDAAVWHFIEGKKSQQEVIIERTEQVIRGVEGETLKNVGAKMENPLREGKTILGVTEYDKTVHIADSTYEGIEKIKQSINATQNPIPAI